MLTLLLLREVSAGYSSPGLLAVLILFLYGRNVKNKDGVLSWHPILDKS